MSGDARKRHQQEDERTAEDSPRWEEGYESPRVDDIPLDRPATTAPAAQGALSEGSPDSFL